MFSTSFFGLVLTILLCHWGSGGGSVVLGHSDSGSDCDVRSIARSIITAFNEERFADAHAHFSPFALSKFNGRLDVSTDGRVRSVNESNCINGKIGKVEFHMGDIVQAGNGFVAVSGSVTVQKAMTGAAWLFEIDEHTCMVETQDVIMGQDHEAYRQLNSGVCQCSAVARSAGLCNSGPLPTNIDVLAITQDCFGAMLAGDAAKYSSCFAPGSIFNVNGVLDENDWSNVNFVRQFFSLIQYSNLDIQNIFTDGRIVNVVGKIAARGVTSGITATPYFYVQLTFDDNGKYSLINLVLDSEEYLRLVSVELNGYAPLYYWKSAGAIAAYQNFYRYFGHPLLSVDHFQAPLNFAWWQVNATANCLDSIYLEDKSYTTTVPIDRTVSAEVYLQVNITSEFYEKVHQISPTIQYDILSHTLTSLANTPGEAVVDMYAAVGVARGQFTVATAQASYSGWLSDASERTGYDRILRTLCLWR